MLQHCLKPRLSQNYGNSEVEFDMSWHALSNTVFHMSPGKPVKHDDGTETQKERCDWTISIHQNSGHTHDETVMLARRLCTLLTHGQAMLDIVEGCAEAGELQFECAAGHTPNPVELITEMHACMGLSDDEKLTLS